MQIFLSFGIIGTSKDKITPPKNQNTHDSELWSYMLKLDIKH